MQFPGKTVIHNFFQRELLSILLWSSLGAIAAALVRALISDHSFDTFLIATYLPPPKRFDEPARYVPYLVTGAVAVVIMVLIRLWRIVKRGITSWAFGVTSGLKFISFASTVIVLSLTRYSIQRRLAVDLAILAVALFCSCVLRYLAIDRSYHIPNEADIRVWKSNSRRRFMSAESAEIYRPSGDQLGENIPSDPGNLEI